MDTNKIFIAVTLAALFPKNSPGQNKSKNVIGISTGYGTIMKADDGFLNGFIGSERKNFSGDFSASVYYMRTISRKTDIGGEISYSSYSSADSREKNDYTFWSVAGKMNYYYIRLEKWRLYSGIALGIMFKTRKEDEFYVNRSIPGGKKTYQEILPSVHLTAFGVEYGKSFCPFTEIGFGTNGAVAGGIRFRF